MGGRGNGLADYKKKQKNHLSTIVMNSISSENGEEIHRFNVEVSESKVNENRFCNTKCHGAGIQSPVNLEDAWINLKRIRIVNPVVQCITNYVSMEFMANVLLAYGASPVMIHNEFESEEFASSSSSLLVNVGTLTPSWIIGMKVAIDATNKVNKPWVLDPVGCGVTSFRTSTTLSLLEKRPTVIRGNPTEIISLYSRRVMEGTKGVDTVHTVAQAETAALALAIENNCVVCVTGAIDYVTDGKTIIRIHNGSPLLTKITATGCAVTAMIAATIACGNSPLYATAYALAYFGVAAELALERQEPVGPGTLRAILTDSIYNMTRDIFIYKAKFSIEYN